MTQQKKSFLERWTEVIAQTYPPSETTIVPQEIDISSETVKRLAAEAIASLAAQDAEGRPVDALSAPAVIDAMVALDINATLLALRAALDAAEAGRDKATASWQKAFEIGIHWQNQAERMRAALIVTDDRMLASFPGGPDSLEAAILTEPSLKAWRQVRAALAAATTPDARGGE